VKESGGPLPSDVVNQIFAPFYTSKEVGRVLSVCKQMAENQGGSLEYDFFPDNNFLIKT
jgi:C4-dicarboxylate-specific signal transduction histidine kinase